MSLEQTIALHVSNAVEQLYGINTEPDSIQIQKTKKEFRGNITVVVFPFVKTARKAPQAVGEEIGAYLVEHTPEVSEYQAVQGFLNLTVSTSYWLETLQHICRDDNYGTQPDNGKLMMEEYSG